MRRQTVTAGFARWIKQFPGPADRRGHGTTVVFPHAGAGAVSYRRLATALGGGGDTVVVQYPQRGDRFGEPAAETLPGLADGLFEAATWNAVAPLRLFGHSMGALVAFEFARIAEARGVAVAKLWVSASCAPSTVAGLGKLPTDGSELLADIADLGGTDPLLLADDEFAQLLSIAVRGDYRAINRYDCEPGVAIRADIHAVGGRDDHRVQAGSLRRWADHTAGTFTLSLRDGGHFYLDEHIDAIAAQVNSHVR